MRHLALLALLLLALPATARPLVVGSKIFTESVILAEALVQLARTAGHDATHRAELGGTQVLWKALRRGDIDAYVEYTGTVAEELIPGRKGRGEEELRRDLAELDVRMSAPLGFNDTYALGMRRDRARALGIDAISDLRRHPELRIGVSHEFLDRAEGWPHVKRGYALPQLNVVGMQHGVAYQAIGAGTIDVTDLYTTDAEIAYHDLIALQDDRELFPDYHAVVLYRADAPAIGDVARRLEGKIDERTMIGLNERAKIKKERESAVAASFLRDRLGEAAVLPRAETRLARIWRHTRQHLFLVLVALGASILISVPLGIVAARHRALGALLLGTAGILQTIPSLALLVFMIPLLGIGAPPALLALTLYGLLPILRNTCVGLRDLPPALLETADALGLPRRARLVRIELPMASRAILAGIKTTAVITVGTATLGAIIGAGGYGEPILVGIRRDDLEMILEGAVPAAALAVLAQGAFSLAERFLVPKGLRL